METSANPLLCDRKTGVCGLPVNDDVTLTGASRKKQIKIIYFTDPICSSCWGIEPQLRKIKLEYGADIDVEYRMGGLLPSWENFNSGGITKAADVAHHWDEVSRYYEMPIDGDVWLEDPLSSSYPPSIAFHAAQLQDGKKAQLYLRKIREMVFIEKKNISKWEHLLSAAQVIGLDIKQFAADYEGTAKELFYNDLELARRSGVRGFPTLYFVNEENAQERLYGYRTYDQFEGIIKKLNPHATKQMIDTRPEKLFFHFDSFTKKEFAIIANISTLEAEQRLDALVEDKRLTKVTTKNGSLWRKPN